jgi:hypothetical protein
MTPELALHIWANAFNAKSASGDALCIRVLHATEVHSQCQDEILALDAPLAPVHCFGDIMDCLPDHVQTLVRRGQSTPDEVRTAILGCTMRRFVWCVRCGKRCHLRAAHLHVAGSPCVDFSMLNLTRKASAGSKMHLFWCWVLQRRTLQEQVLIHENVPSFGLSLLESSLGDQGIHTVVRSPFIVVVI